MNPAGDYPYVEPHAYVATGVGQWRTCALCGRGANAKIHRPGAVLSPGGGIVETGGPTDG